MKLQLETYELQKSRWPRQGRHILAQFDDDTIVVYQAYNSTIGHFAAKHGYFGGEFRLSRMSWLKPNFLWMMYRCGWATKPNQEVVLAIRLTRTAFDLLLAQAVHSTHDQDIYGTEAMWKRRVAQSSVRLQWDPDHSPTGGKLSRRAIQLGLRGDTLRQYAHDWIVEIEDITELVHEQAAHKRDPAHLLTPTEAVYVPANPELTQHLGLCAAQS